MEDCIDDMSFRKDALTCFNAQGFFINLEPMAGALEALKAMEREGLELYICTSPIKSSRYCAQEKLDWVREHLGEEWLDRVILCQDKTTVVGDILIDDKV
ncbi:5'-deoxyribonucleotidase [Ochromonadaceae sp. CCMP2298]|nr:5'-deoxyribonucleotidase [Ochromonadaceae sp. CCMP2298]